MDIPDPDYYALYSANTFDNRRYHLKKEPGKKSAQHIVCCKTYLIKTRII